MLKLLRLPLKEGTPIILKVRERKNPIEGKKGERNKERARQKHKIIEKNTSVSITYLSELNL